MSDEKLEIKRLLFGEPVTVLCNNKEHKEKVKNVLNNNLYST